MIDGLYPYPAYKPSGVPWLGDVPKHWEAGRLKKAATIIAGQSPPSEVVSEYLDCFPFLQGNAEFGHRYPKARLACGEPPKRAKAADILLSVRAPVGALNVADRGYGIGRGLCAVRAGPGLDALFAYHVLGVAKHELLRLSTGSTYDAVTIGIVGSLGLAFPPLPEQAAIVRYLDHADRRIRRYVSAKRKLIALLEEEKQAVINQAVTGGLDSNVPLKPSGVEWLGDVPEHWEVRRLGYLATKFGSGVTPRGGATVYQGDGVPLLRSQNIHFDGLRMQKVARIAPKLHQELSGSHVRPGDVLLNITGASIGRVCSVPEGFTEGNVNQHVCIIRPAHARLLPNFLAVYLSIPALQRGIQLEQSGASREGLTLHSIRNFKVVLPPLLEQRVIVEHLNKTIAGINAAIVRARRQIELVQEYRTRLIADVVTGKLDVREAAAQLPDEPDDEEPVGEDDPAEDADGELCPGSAAWTGTPIPL